jgi:hypothetical protein
MPPLKPSTRGEYRLSSHQLGVHFGSQNINIAHLPAGIRLVQVKKNRIQKL